MNHPLTMTDRQAQRLLGATGKALNRPLDGEDANLGWGDDCLPIFDMTKLDGPEPDPVTFALDKFIPETEVTLFTGEGGVGKSLCAQQLATCMAAKLPFLGLSTSIRGDDGVLYVTAEEGADELERRQRAINRMLGLQRLDIDDLLHLSSLRGKEGNELCTFDAEGKIQPTPAFRKLSHTICRGGIGTVILDNVAHLFGGNENDRRQVTAFVNLLYKLVRIYHCTIVLIGHPNKSGDSYSGSTAWLNAVRSQMFMERIEDENGHEPDPNRRVIVNPKANYAPSQQRLAFRWHEGAFARDEDLPSDYREEMAKAQKAAAENEIFLRCLRARMATLGREVGPSMGPNYAPARFAEMTEAKGMKKPALARAMERLIYVGAITTKEVKRKGNETKTIIVEVDPNASELPSEPLPNTASEPFRTSVRTVPRTHPISKDIIRAGPPNGPPPDLDDEGVEY